MLKAVLRAYAPLSLFIFFCGSTFAQTEIAGSTLNGTVTDPSGSSVSGAQVRIASPATGFTRATASNESGFYNFVRLPVGTYNLAVEQPGFRSLRRVDVRLEVGSVVTLDIRLEVGATQETITVTSDAPLLETSRTQTSTVVNEKAVADLPVNGRNFLDFTRLTPGVVSDPTRGGDLSFGGQRGPANSLLVDGADSNNVFFGQATGRTGFRPYAFSQDAVQEFQVNTNDYPAEIGRAGGGVINAITKSGTNSYHGSAFEFYRDKGLNANTFTNNRAGVKKPAYHFNQFGGSFGGPLVKDNLFFFANYDGQRNTLPNVLVINPAPPADVLAQLQPYLTPYTVGVNNDVFLGKLDWNASADQRVSLRYNANRVTAKNSESGGLASALEHTGNSKVTTDNIVGSYSRVFGGNVVWDFRQVYLRDNEPGEANSTAPETQVFAGGGSAAITFGRNNFSPRYTNIRDSQTVSSVSYIRGRHTMKFGADLNFEHVANFFPGLFSGSYRFNSYADFTARRPAQFSQAFAGPGTPGALTAPNVSEYAFFAQDSWRVNNRLTLNYGIRYDLYDYAQPKIRNPDPGLAAMQLRTDRINVDTNNIAPRFGFAYKPFHSDRVVVRGGYGIFYARTPTILTGTAFSQNGLQVRTYILTANLPTYPNLLPAAPGSGAPPSIFVVAPDFASPLTHQYSFNLDTDLGHNLLLTAGYLGVHGEHLSRTRDINLFPSVLVQGRFADGTPTSFYRHPGPASGPSRPNPAFGRISVFDSGADSVYHGGFMQLTKRFANNFQFLTSYTFSKVLDSVPDATAVVTGADDSKVAQDTLLPNLDRGPGSTDIRHRFVFSGVWDMPYARSLSNPVLRALLRDYQLSTIAQIQSGRRFSAAVGGDPNNDGNPSTDRVPYVGRNTIVGPWFATVDLRVSRDIPLFRESVKMRLLGEAFNLTNRANFNTLQNSQYSFAGATNTFTPRTDFLARLNTFDARILQLAVKIIF